MMVYGLTGLPGSGKSEVARIAREHGFPLIRMGDMVWEHVRELGLPLTPEIVGKMAQERREKEGADIWAKKTIEHIRQLLEKESPKYLFIDGIRSMDEVDCFGKRFEDFRIVGMHSSPATRYQRISARKRVDDTLSFKSFQERERRELSWGVAQVIALADIMIVNEGSLKELRERTQELLQ